VIRRYDALRDVPLQLGVQAGESFVGVADALLVQTLDCIYGFCQNRDGNRPPRFEWKKRRDASDPPGRVYVVAIALLAIAILLQVLLEFRDTLAAHVPATRALLAGACRALSCTLEPLKDTALYPDVKAPGKHLVRAIAASPSSKGLNPSYVALISAIESAETEVLITNAYFVPHPQLLQALQDAARRGVKVKLVLPSKTDNAVVYHAGRSFYSDLLEAGVRIYERKSRLLHAKSAVIDGVWSTVGSTNLDWRSLAYNDELNAVVLGPEFGAQMQGIFAKDVSNSEEITLEKWRSRPFEDRVKEMAAKAWSQLL